MLDKPEWFDVAARAYKIQVDAQRVSGKLQSLRRFIPLPGLFLKVDYRAEWESGRRLFEEVKNLTELMDGDSETASSGNQTALDRILLSWLNALAGFCEALQAYAYTQFSFWATEGSGKDRMVSDSRTLGRAESKARAAADMFLTELSRRDCRLYRSVRKGKWLP